MNCLKSFLPAVLLCLAVTLTACQEAEPQTGDRDDAAAQNEELARQFIEAYNAQDRATLEELLADPFVYNGNEMDLEAFLGLNQMFWGSFPDIVFEPTHVVGANDYVTVRVEFIGTGEGEFAGYDVDGREIHSTEMILFGVEDNQLTEYWVNWDEVTFWEQLGVLESPWPEE